MNFDKFFINKLNDSTKAYLHKRGIFTESVKHDEGLNFILEIRKLINRDHEPYDDEIGTHPDYIDLETDDQSEFGHLCSVSVDIKNSTKLNLKYDQSVAKDIKQSIMKSIIDIYTAFDGHIHRLQGDGVVVFFRNINKPSQCIIDAINASVFLMKFREETLSKVFEKFGLKNIKLRIGMDFGDDTQVLWSKFGTRNVTEVTASGINVDLAFKIEKKIPSNSIGISENIVKYLDLRDELISTDSHIEDGEKINDVYILENPHYKYFILKWNKYINEVFTVLSSNNKLEIKLEARKSVPEDQANNNPWTEVISGSDCLEKEYDLSFKAYYKGEGKAFSYRWKVQNYGQEAKENSEDNNFIMEGFTTYNCLQSTKYTSLHYMDCTVFNEGKRILTSKKFGVYINDEIREIRDLREEYHNEH